MSKTTITDDRLVDIKVEHQAQMPGWYWVTPNGWTPKMPEGFANDPQFEFIDGAICGEDEEAAGIVVFETDFDEAENEEDFEVAPLSRLWWAYSGQCQFDRFARVEIGA